VSGLGRPAAARAAKSSGRLKPPKASRPSRRNSRRRCGPGQNKAATAPVPFLLFKNYLIIACSLLARQLARSTDSWFRPIPAATSPGRCGQATFLRRGIERARGSHVMSSSRRKLQVKRKVAICFAKECTFVKRRMATHRNLILNHANSAQCPGPVWPMNITIGTMLTLGLRRCDGWARSFWW
jgi:hypothetical protein